MTMGWLIPESVKRKIRCRAGAITMHDRLLNLRTCGFNPRQIIDAGAFHGTWALIAHGLFPSAQILMIEPQPHLSGRLEELCRGNRSLKFHPSLLGKHQGSVRFLLQESNSRIVGPDFRASASEQVLELPIKPLMDIALAEGFGACDFLKLDLQGHELAALAGARPIFGQAEVILCECSWLRIGPVPVAHEVIQTFTAKGYLLYDVFGFNYRPRDRALWQTDFLFVHERSPLLASRSWD